ncbi:single-stranded DNA-binding protein [Flavobacterium sp. ST-75]|uniref:Single-stranded DNA-binding protein n=1 Tax=Flavobacterium rhizophilum TaxID=3163296 RepID=A0ABW8YA50_9FLAO
MNIIGRVTRDAEVRALNNERQVVHFSVAANDGYRNRQGEYIEQPTFFDCSYFISPKVATMLTKGTLVELAGRVSARAWMDKEGQPKAGLNYIASRIKVHAKAGSSRQSPEDIEVNQPVVVSPHEGNNKQGGEHDDLPF